MKAVIIAGGLGTSDRLHYTIIGDTVNTTQRLEGLSRDLFDGSAILVSHATFSALSEHQSMFDFQPLGYHQVKGKQEKTENELKAVENKVSSTDHVALDPKTLDNLIASFVAKSSMTAALKQGFEGPPDPSQ